MISLNKIVFYRLLRVLPLAVPAATAVLSIVAVTLLVMGRFETLWFIVLGVPLALLTFYVVFKSAYSRDLNLSKKYIIFDLVAVAFIGVWAVFNLYYAAQNIFVYRDPGAYTVTGAGLIDNNNIKMTADTVFGAHPDIRGDSAGFYEFDDGSGRVYPHGQHLLASFLGLAGRIDDRAIFHLNVIFGAFALLAVYGFARLILRPIYAIFAIVCLGLTLPMLYFSRDNYTEPLALLFTFGSLSLLWAAQKYKQTSMYFIAGLTAGAGLLTRIDAYIGIAGMIAAVGITLALTKRKNDRRKNIFQAATLMLGIVIAGLVSWLDLTKLSSYYYDDHRLMILAEIAMIAALLVGGAFLCAFLWKTKLLSRVSETFKVWAPKLVVVAALVIVIVLALRPLWGPSTEGYIIEEGGGGVQTTVVYDSSLADTGDGYSPESVVTWVVWYLGPVAALFGLVGFLLILSRSLRRDRLLLPAVFVFSATALVFFVSPSITPDQVWASRRLLPVVLPFLIIAAFYGLTWLFDKAKTKRFIVNVVMAVTVAVVTLSPLLVSHKFLTTREGVPQYQQMKSVCTALPGGAAVLWIGAMSEMAVQSTRAFCKVPSEGFKSQSSPDVTTLAGAAKSARDNGFVPVVGVTESDLSRLNAQELSNVSTIYFDNIEKVFRKPPDQVLASSRAIYLGVIQEDGSIKPLK